MQILLPVILGIATVLQAGINRKMADSWGWGGAVLTNSVILLIITAIAVLTGLLHFKFQVSEFKLWYILPGFLGFAIVLGLPYCVSRLGAFTTFMLVIGAQLMMSGAWDYYIESSDFSWRKIAGGLLAFIGTWIAVR